MGELGGVTWFEEPLTETELQNLMRLYRRNQEGGVVSDWTLREGHTLAKL